MGTQSEMDMGVRARPSRQWVRQWRRLGLDFRVHLVRGRATHVSIVLS